MPVRPVDLACTGVAACHHGIKRTTLATIPVIVALTYWQASGAYFIEDDFQWLVSAWYFDPAKLVDFGRYNHFYRPIVEVYFYLTVKAFGHSVPAFHWAAILLHALNGLIVFGMMQTIADDDTFAAFAAIIFVVLPGFVDAVAWVGAIAEPLSTLFYCLTLWLFLLYLRSRRRDCYIVAIGTFALALITHEGATTLLIMMVLVGWFARFFRGALGRQPGAIQQLVDYVPFAIVLAAYLMIDFSINSRNYVVAEASNRLAFEGYYGFSGHVLTNVLDYIVSLYIGKRILASYVAIITATVILLRKGSALARLAVLWILITLLPFAVFIWGNTSRYLYLPAIGFAMLFAEGMVAIDRLVAVRLSSRWRLAVVSMIFMTVFVRFLVFTTRGVQDFVARTAAYRNYIDTFRADHSQLQSGALVRVPIPHDRRLHKTYLEPLVQWEYRDPTIRLQLME